MTDREYQGTRELGNSQGILEMLKKKKSPKVLQKQILIKQSI